VFRFIAPQKIIFGREAIEGIGEEVRVLGKRILLVSGRGSMRKSGVLERIRSLLNLSHLEVTLYEGIPQEPSLEVVDEGLRMARECRCDVVLGLGGGSVIDVGKAVAALLKDGGKAIEYQHGRKIAIKGVPFVAVPTTSGTGAEATYNAVILNREERAKRSIRDPSLMASLVIVDPILTLSLPPKITAITGMDALTHLIEGYTSKGANPITDPLAIKGVVLIGKYLRAVVKNGDNLPSREGMSLASLLGGMVLANAGLGAVHGLAASLGPIGRIPHGLACALLLPYVVEYNYREVSSKYREIDEALGGKSGNLPKTIKALLEDIGISEGLGEVGIREDDLEEITKKVSSSINYNPRRATTEDLIHILKVAM
jgi:alcohol dehydrogenase class IV